METPRSLETANQFMAQGRNGSSDHSDAYEMDVCNPQNVQNIGPYKLDGSRSVPADVDYDRCPDRLNPRSVAGQNPEHDAQGK